MDNSKITVSLDEVNSSSVDAELHRIDVAERMAQHQSMVQQTESKSAPASNRQGLNFRSATVYMAIFGLVGAIIAWGLGEVPLHIQESSPWSFASGIIRNYYTENPDATIYDFYQMLSRVKENVPEQKDNPYLQREFWEQGKDQRQQAIEAAKFQNSFWYCIWYCIIASLISLALSSAEAFMSKNMDLAVKNIVLGALLGTLGGIVMFTCVEWLYHVMGGGQSEQLAFQQMLARGIGWGLLGGFVAMAPGIMMKSKKKFMLGVAGGVIGGCLGGFLFDPICAMFGSDVPARFVNIITLGVGTAVATVLLENIAKQGWLKVASGLIAGKQFILYRNPTVIGSSPKSEIYLFKDPSISPKHAAINNVNGDFIITAIDSSPVLVNNSPVRQEKLKTGDRIQIGSTTFIFEAKVIKNK